MVRKPSSSRWSTGRSLSPSPPSPFSFSRPLTSFIPFSPTYLWSQGAIGVDAEPFLSTYCAAQVPQDAPEVLTHQPTAPPAMMKHPKGHVDGRRGERGNRGDSALDQSRGWALSPRPGSRRPSVRAGGFRVRGGHRCARGGVGRCSGSEEARAGHTWWPGWHGPLSGGLREGRLTWE